jgi:hypothetical protein
MDILPRGDLRRLMFGVRQTGGSSVVVVEAAEGIQRFAGYPVDLEESDLTTIKAVAFACRRCGFVRFHMHPGG